MATMRKYFVRPWIVMPLVAVVALGAWWFWFRPDDGDAAAADTEQLVAATTGTMAQTVSADGTIAAAQTDDLSFTAAGTVTAVNGKAGQQVKAGEVLATIDSAELAAAVAEADASVADAAAKQADDEDAGASDAQLDADASALASAQDKLDAARDDLAGAQLVATFDGTVASVDLTVGEQLAGDGTGSTDPTGSGSGSGQTDNDLGGGNGSFAPDAADSSSDGSTAQIQVVSTSSYTIDLGFDDTDIAKLAAGQTASIALSTSSQSVAFPGGGAFPRGGPGTFTAGPTPGGSDAPKDATDDSGDDANASDDSGSAPVVTGTPAASGTVTEVGAVADASSGVASYPVTVAFTDTTGDYHPGATATVTITYAQVENVVQVPAFAVTTTNGTSTVTVSADGKKETRAVTTGLTSGGMVEITSGLAAGEQVVITRPEGLRFGGPAGGTGG